MFSHIHTHIFISKAATNPFSAHKQASHIHSFISRTATHPHSQLTTKRHTWLFSSLQHASHISLISIALIFGANQQLLTYSWSNILHPRVTLSLRLRDPWRISKQNKNVKHNPPFKDIPSHILSATGTVGLNCSFLRFGWQTNRPQMTHSQPALRSHNTIFLLQKESDVYMGTLTEQSNLVSLYFKQNRNARGKNNSRVYANINDNRRCRCRKGT
jgi:hypothetical protein